MPYKIKQHGNKFSVVNSDTGKVMGTHPSKKKAKAQLGALYANVPDAVEKLLLTGGEGFSIEFNTPDCQDGYCIIKNGTAQSIGCWKTKAEAEEALKGMVGESTNILGDEVRTTKTPEEIQEDRMNKCLTCGCGDVTDDHNHDEPTMDSFWKGVFVPANKGFFFDPGFNSTEQDATYYFPAKASYENDGKPSVGYGNRSSNDSIRTGENTPDRTTRPGSKPWK